jgi:hypothetical protein
MKRGAEGPEKKYSMFATASNGIAIRFFQQNWSSSFRWKSVYSEKLRKTNAANCYLKKTFAVTSAKLNNHFQGSRKFNGTN